MEAKSREWCFPGGKSKLCPRNGVSGVKNYHCLNLSFKASSLLQEDGISAAVTLKGGGAVVEKIPCNS